MVKEKEKHIENWNEYKPSPFVATCLSSVIPGSGQIYTGKIFSGILMLALFLLSLGGMCDYLFKPSRPEWFFYWGIPALVVFVANWLISILDAYHSAKNHKGFGRLFRAITYYLAHNWKAGIIADALIWPVFLYGAVGIALNWRGAFNIADIFRYWFIFELAGTLFFGICSDLTDSSRIAFRLNTRKELVIFVVIYMVFASIGAIWLRMYMLQLLFAALIIVPGKILNFLGAGPDRRWEYSQRAGFSMVAFIIALPVAIIVLHFAEDPPYQLLPKEICPQFFSMLLASLYFLLRTGGEAWYRLKFGYER